MNMSDLVSWTKTAQFKNKLDKIVVTNDDMVNTIKLLKAVIDGKSPKLSDFKLKTYPFCEVFLRLIKMWKNKHDVTKEVNDNALMDLLQQTHWRVDDKQINPHCIRFRTMIFDTVKKLGENK